MSKCGGCGKFLAGGITCTKCKVMHHRQCVNISPNQTPKNWLCPGCIVNIPRKDNSDTPVKEPTEHNIIMSESPQDHGDCNEQLLQEIQALRKEMKVFRTEFGSFREEVRGEMRDLRELYQSCTNKMDTFSERLDSQEARLVQLELACKETHNLKTEINNLKQELCKREQTSLQNDIELNGVTEHKGENILHIIGLITSKIGLSLDEREIIEAKRVGPIHTGEDGKQRSRPVVVRLARRAVHEQVLRCARVRRHLTTADIELAGVSRPIYINERLTKENRLIFSRARRLCKLHNWKYAWTREGKVLVREADGKQAFRIRVENDLETVFKNNPTTKTN